MKVFHIQVAFVLFSAQHSSAFTISTPLPTNTINPTSSLFPRPQQHTSSQSLAAASTALNRSGGKNEESKPGLFSFKTKYGYLNPYAIYYGVVAILLGIPWFIALNVCQVLYKLSGNKLDKFRFLPIFFSQLWGIALLRLTRSYPEVEGKEILEKYYKQ